MYCESYRAQADRHSQSTRRDHSRSLLVPLHPQCIKLYAMEVQTTNNALHCWCDTLTAVLHPGVGPHPMLPQITERCVRARKRSALPDAASPIWQHGCKSDMLFKEELQKKDVHMHNSSSSSRAAFSLVKLRHTSTAYLQCCLGWPTTATPM